MAKTAFVFIVSLGAVADARTESCTGSGKACATDRDDLVPLLQTRIHKSSDLGVDMSLQVPIGKDKNTLKDFIESGLRCVPEEDDESCQCKERLRSLVCQMSDTKRFGLVKFDEADLNKDGTVSKEEMEKIATVDTSSSTDADSTGTANVPRDVFVQIYLQPIIEETDRVFNGSNCKTSEKTFWNDRLSDSGFDHSYLKLFCIHNAAEPSPTVGSNGVAEEDASFIHGEEHDSPFSTKPIDELSLAQSSGAVRHDVDMSTITSETRYSDYVNHSVFSKFTKAERVAAKEMAFAGVAKSFAALLAADFCWKDVWARPTTGRHCKSGWYQGGSGLDVGFCYRHCRGGYGRFGDHCWESCPSNMNDLGAYCQREYWGDCCANTWFGRACVRCPKIQAKTKHVYHEPGCSVTSDHCSGCPGGYYAYGWRCYKHKKAGYGCHDWELTCDRTCTDDAGLATDCGAACSQGTAACVANTFDMVQGLIDAVVNTAVLVVSFGTATGAVLAKNTAKNCAKAAAKNARRNAVRVSQSAFKRQVREYRKKLIKDAIKDNMKGKLQEKAQNDLVAYAFSEAETLTEYYFRAFEDDKNTNTADRMNKFTQDIDVTGISAAIDGSTGANVDDANKQAANWLTVASFVDPTGITGAVAGFIKHSYCESTIAKAEQHLAGQIKSLTANKIGCFGNLMEVGSAVTPDSLHAGPLCSSYTCPEGFIKVDSDNVCHSSGCSTGACCEKVVERAPTTAPEVALFEERQYSGDQLDQSSNMTYNLPAGWTQAAGGCNDNGGVTHCKYSQSSGWHRWDIPLYSGGIATGRAKCGEEGSRLPGAIGAQFMHLWGWQFCVVFFPPGRGCGGVKSGHNVLPAGYYQEWIGRNGHAPLSSNGNTAHHSHCFWKASCR